MSRTIDWLTTNGISFIEKDGAVIITQHLIIKENDNVTLENVTNTGDVSVNEGATLTATALTNAGNVYVYEGATLTATALTNAGNVYVREGATFIATALTTVNYVASKMTILGYNVEVFDNIGCVVLSTKKKGDVVIRSCRKASFKGGKLVGDKFYVASNDKHNAHANSPKEAVEELLFKAGDRDISMYKDMPLTTTKTPDEWAFIYRITTGACKTGVKIFMESQKLKKQYTLQEIIEHTKNQYNSHAFRKAVGE